MKCMLLNIEMIINKLCPSKYNLDGDKCYVNCGFSEKSWNEMNIK